MTLAMPEWHVAPGKEEPSRPCIGRGCVSQPRCAVSWFGRKSWGGGRAGERGKHSEQPCQEPRDISAAWIPLWSTVNKPIMLKLWIPFLCLKSWISVALFEQWLLGKFFLAAWFVFTAGCFGCAVLLEGLGDITAPAYPHLLCFRLNCKPCRKHGLGCLCYHVELMINRQELWVGRGTKRPCFHSNLRSRSRAKAPLCFCWSGSDCKTQPWEGLTHRCSDTKRRLRGAVLPTLPKVTAMPPLAFCPFFPALCPDKGCSSEHVHLHLALLWCKEVRCSCRLSTPALQKVSCFFLCNVTVLQWSRVVMQHCRSPSSPPGLLPTASAKTGAARRDANGCGRAGSLGTLILVLGSRGCLQSQDWGKPSSCSSCPGILRALSSSVFFHPPFCSLSPAAACLPHFQQRRLPQIILRACQGYGAGHKSTAYIYVSG